MATEFPVGSAADVARRLRQLQGEVDDPPSLAQFFSLITRFEAVRFDVPTSEDSDGFLFQYGAFNIWPEPTFSVGITRQLEMIDSGGECGGYVQVSMDYLYDSDDELASAARETSWWFRGSVVDFSTWIGSVEEHAVWRLISSRRPRTFVISQDGV
ncbi:hypothetical protein [Kineococcus xinjiangensis]|uniref:hypothetical protein n=1 Tax=Kineococcus xinjiangensis TaxID=512762 RepID=UPI000CECAD8B|nr:hypothetical protein [Kineococcus xinjiangensis]